MQENWSLILNVLLLIGVVVAINRMLKAKRQTMEVDSAALPSVGQVEPSANRFDDIIAVRKVAQEPAIENSPRVAVRPSIDTAEKVSDTAEKISPIQSSQARKVVSVGSDFSDDRRAPTQSRPEETPVTVMLFLLAKETRQLAGYELLQTVLAAGLRFGEGQLFHRHQYPNGQGPVLCSLAAATATGVFDLQNIGALRVRGLCLFMQASGSPAIDAERFEIMLDTAKQLSDGLDTYLLDDKRQPLTDAGIQRYYEKLNATDDIRTVEEVV